MKKRSDWPAAEAERLQALLRQEAAQRARRGEDHEDIADQALVELVSKYRYADLKKAPEALARTILNHKLTDAGRLSSTRARNREKLKLSHPESAAAITPESFDRRLEREELRAVLARWAEQTLRAAGAKDPRALADRLRAYVRGQAQDQAENEECGQFVELVDALATNARARSTGSVWGRFVLEELEPLLSKRTRLRLILFHGHGRKTGRRDKGIDGRARVAEAIANPPGQAFALMPVLRSLDDEAALAYLVLGDELLPEKMRGREPVLLSEAIRKIKTNYSNAQVKGPGAGTARRRSREREARRQENQRRIREIYEPMQREFSRIFEQAAPLLELQRYLTRQNEKFAQVMESAKLQHEINRELRRRERQPKRKPKG